MRSLAVVLLLSVSFGLSADSAENNAWASGEKLDYTVKFGIFTAGTATFFAGPESNFGGGIANKFGSILKSSPRFFYTLNDNVVSYSEKNSLTTLRYEKTQRESNENSVEVTVYDHAAGTAVRTEDGRAHPTIQVVKNSKDVLGIIYHVREQNLAPGQRFNVPVHDGKRQYTMEITVGKRERIKTEAGEFDCLLIEPRLRLPDGTYRKKGQMTLWMTDDNRHIPVRIKIAIPIGSLMLNLKTMTGTRGVL